MYLAIEASLPSEETEQMQKHANLDEHLDIYTRTIHSDSARRVLLHNEYSRRPSKDRPRQKHGRSSDGTSGGAKAAL